MSQHIHKETIDSHGQGTCTCGRIQQYNLVDNKQPPVLVKAGDTNYHDPESTSAATSGKLEMEKPKAALDYLPPEPIRSDLTKHQTGFWYNKMHDEYADAIIRCICKIGFNETRSQWRFSTQGFMKFLKKWGRLDLIPEKISKCSESHKRHYKNKKDIPELKSQTGTHDLKITANYVGVVGIDDAYYKEIGLGKAGNIRVEIRINILEMTPEQFDWMKDLVTLINAYPKG